MVVVMIGGKQHIGRSIPCAYEFLKQPAVVGFNMRWSALQTSAGLQLARAAKDSGRAVFAWTINQEDTMKSVLLPISLQQIKVFINMHHRWAIEAECIDGVCTDDPIKFLEYDQPFLPSFFFAWVCNNRLALDCAVDMPGSG